MAVLDELQALEELKETIQRTKTHLANLYETLALKEREFSDKHGKDRSFDLTVTIDSGGKITIEEKIEDSEGSKEP